MTKVSVIVPIYNIEAYLEKCIKSLLKQTLKDIEIILVNDCSTDNSQSIIDKYVKKDKRVKAYINEKNSGLSFTRNHGMKYAKGEYLSFIDGDDYIEPDMLEKMYDKAKEEDADIVECDFVLDFPNKKIINRSKLDENIIVSIRVAAWNKLYRRKLVEKLKLEFPVGLLYEDVVFCYKIIPFANKISYVPEPFYHYIQRPQSLINTKNKRVREIYDCLNMVLDYYKEKKIYEKYKDQLEFIYMRYILSSSLLRVNKIKDGKLRHAIFKEGFDLLSSKFPKWNKNVYIRKLGFLKWFYYKTINRFTYYCYALAFRIVGFDKWII
jgi:hypothetical protein